MGTCLQAFLAKSNTSRQEQRRPGPSDDKGPTHRNLRIPQSPEAQAPEQKGNLNDSSNNNSMRGDTKIFTNHASTGIGLSEQERRSSIFLGNPFETDSILIKSPNERVQGSKEDHDKFYTLIDKVYFMRKSMDTIRVSSPHGESELNCNVNMIVSTFYLTEGLPLESIKEVTTGKIIQTTESPIKIILKAKCLTPSCDRRIKLTFSKSILDISQVECDKCLKKGEWALLDLDSNFPVWGDGRKIQMPDDKETKLPSSLRALGCIVCLKYSCLDPKTCKQFHCGCLLCEECQKSSQQEDCHICNS